MQNALMRMSPFCVQSLCKVTCHKIYMILYINPVVRYISLRIKLLAYSSFSFKLPHAIWTLENFVQIHVEVFAFNVRTNR